VAFAIGDEVFAETPDRVRHSANSSYRRWFSPLKFVTGCWYMLDAKRETIAGLECISVGLANRQEAPDGVVVLCHGYGAPGTDLVSISAEYFSENSESTPCVVFMFPAAPLEIEPGFDGRAWWPIDVQRLQDMIQSGESHHLANVVPERLETCRVMIDEVVATAMNRWSLLGKRILIGGFSQGAMLATEVMLQSKHDLGGLIAWSGTLINQVKWRQLATQRTPFSVIQTHGFWDPILPFSGAVDLRELLRSAGHHVDFQSFQGYHTIPPSAINTFRNFVRTKFTA
jgi:phospholipase/carboxylesterase